MRTELVKHFPSSAADEDMENQNHFHLFIVPKRRRRTGKRKPFTLDYYFPLPDRQFDPASRKSIPETVSLLCVMPSNLFFYFFKSSNHGPVSALR